MSTLIEKRGWNSVAPSFVVHIARPMRSRPFCLSAFAMEWKSPPVLSLWAYTSSIVPPGVARASR